MGDHVQTDVDESFWDTGPPTKVCKKCRKRVSVDCFRRNLDKRDNRKYRSPYCLSCEKYVASEWLDRVAKNGLTNRDNIQNRLRGNHSIGLDVNEAIRQQGGVCAICRQPETKRYRNSINVRRLSLDHDHKTGKKREFLCLNCNLMIGHAKDDAFLLEAAAAYLRKHAET